MPADPEATPKPRTRRKAPVDGLASLVTTGADETDPSLSKILAAVARLQECVDHLDDQVHAIGIVVSGNKPADPSKSQQQFIEKADLILEVFRLYLHLTTEADRSTKQRVRTIRKVLDRYMARHDKAEAKRQPLTWTNIGLLAVGSILAIIGVVSVIDWVFS